MVVQRELKSELRVAHELSDLKGLPLFSEIEYQVGSRRHHFGTAIEPGPLRQRRDSHRPSPRQTRACIPNAVLVPGSPLSAELWPWQNQCGTLICNSQ